MGLIYLEQLHNNDIIMLPDTYITELENMSVHIVYFVVASLILIEIYFSFYPINRKLREDLNHLPLPYVKLERYIDLGGLQKVSPNFKSNGLLNY